MTFVTLYHELYVMMINEIFLSFEPLLIYFICNCVKLYTYWVIFSFNIKRFGFGYNIVFILHRPQCSGTVYVPKFSRNNGVHLILISKSVGIHKFIRGPLRMWFYCEIFQYYLWNLKPSPTDCKTGCTIITLSDLKRDLAWKAFFLPIRHFFKSQWTNGITARQR